MTYHDDDGPRVGWFEELAAFGAGFVGGYALGNSIFSGGKDKGWNDCCAGSSAFIVVVLLVLAVLL